MLVSLHVKNLALIDEEEILFGDGLNILSGETGAGKSIILGALDLALGGKIQKDALRDENAEGLVEAVFSVSTDKEREALRALEIEPYDDEVILTRKISATRAAARINGETVPAGKMRDVGALLLDIHGQHDHQSLLHKKKHLEFLDAFAKDALGSRKEELAEAYRAYVSKKEEYDNANLDEQARARELSFLQHEVEEIENARLRPGEDDEVEEEYRKMANSHKIMDALNEAYGETGAADAAGDRIGRALRMIHMVSEYDEAIGSLADQLADVDNLLNDFNRELSDYMSSAEFNGERFAEVESRLNLINDLKAKYGASIELILEELEKKQARIEKLADYDLYLENLAKEVASLEAEVARLCDEISGIRKNAAEDLCAQVRQSLLDLNFLDVKFSMDFAELAHYTANGKDDCEFLISTNPGEPVRPLKDIASGGELSRVMLALKTVMAEGDDIDTLIFDEIDAGISGRTAQAVSEKLSVLGRRHQVICITHLPQIAAMADHHFLIEKNVESGATISRIHSLYGDEIVDELARMLGGAVISDAVRENAREMKNLASAKKDSL
ncbi:MAG: DNA repair protein RecN [Lachnospiraceae bacterium]|nr:DNA repair protein RecN [Lachnospiraceae bacterium]